MKQFLNYLKMDMSAHRVLPRNLLKRLAVLVVWVASVQLSHGFALLGPFEPYQGAAIGYQQIYVQYLTPGGPTSLQDLGGPHQLGEEFRRNLPMLTYAFDEGFYQFFGSNGVAAVDQAFAIMNSLTNVSQYSRDLSEFPLQAQRINYLAQSLALTDVKSITLHLLVEQMGLAQPERYTWTLHDRNMGNPCPDTGLYMVIQRNFEVFPTPLNQWQASSYVNGILYTYGIFEDCGPPDPLAVAVPYAVDPLAETHTSVAADAVPFLLLTTPGLNSGGLGLHIGGFYTYITRDDMGGLRYLLETNNINYEQSGPNTVQFITNSNPQFLITQDLALLAAQAPTNSAAQLQALYPGLIVNQVATWFGLAVTTNLSLVVVPAPFAPAGFVQVVTVTNYTTNIVQFFSHTFGNIFTNSFSTRSLFSIQTISPGSTPFAPAGAAPPLRTNTVNRSGNAIAGDFFIIPAGLCAIQIVTNLLSTVIATTNTISVSTNVVAGGTSNQTMTVNIISYFTNNTIVYLPVTCPANTIGWRGGIERVRFVRRDDYDPISGFFFAPVTNTYSVIERNITNSTSRLMQFQSVATQPDFLFNVDDIASGPGGNAFVGTVQRFMNFNQQAPAIAEGPGTIEGPTTFTFNNVGPVFWNAYNATLVANSLDFIADESSQIRSTAWGSFDGSTNDPVIYPNGTSIANYINQIMMRIGPSVLPPATNGVPYTSSFSVIGGQPPFTWSLASGSAGLPAGLTLSPGGVVSGTPTGVTFATQFDFTVRATDVNFRTVEAPVTLIILP
jgi:hypothetical protein